MPKLAQRVLVERAVRGEKLTPTQAAALAQLIRVKQLRAATHQMQATRKA